MLFFNSVAGDFNQLLRIVVLLKQNTPNFFATSGKGKKNISVSIVLPPVTTYSWKCSWRHWDDLCRKSRNSQNEHRLEFSLWRYRTCWGKGWCLCGSKVCWKQGPPIVGRNPAVNAVEKGMLSVWATERLTFTNQPVYFRIFLQILVKSAIFDVLSARKVWPKHVGMCHESETYLMGVKKMIESTSSKYGTHAAVIK